MLATARGSASGRRTGASRHRGMGILRGVMADRMQTGLCPTCREQRLLRQPRPNHVLHLILSVLTAGLWLIVWLILVARSSGASARCTVCGTPLRKQYDAQQGTHRT